MKGQRTNDVSGISDEGLSQALNKSTEEREKPVNRRSIFGAGLLGVVSAVAAACSGTDFVSGGSSNRKQGTKKPGSDGFGDDGSDGVGPGDDGGADNGTTDTTVDGTDSVVTDGTDGPATDQGLDKCDPLATQKVDIAGMPKIDNDPELRIYGRKKSRMLAVLFNNATTFDQLLICNSSGRVLAVHMPNPADKNEAGWRPIVIDNLNFDEKDIESPDVVLVIQQGNDRKQFKDTLKGFDTFNGKPVKDLANGLPGGWEPAKQSVLRLETDRVGYNRDTTENMVYPGGRKLKTITSEARLTFTSTAAKGGSSSLVVAGSIVTDIMGNELTNITGANAATAVILETPVLCSYKLSSDGNSYIRTIIHVA